MIPVLRRATHEDAPAIHALLVQCGRAMSAAGFDNWNPPATLERVQKDIAQREVYIALEGNEIIATVTAAQEPTVPYQKPRWKDNRADALYVNRLAVKPDRQGSGLGSWLTKKMEDRARDLEVRFVRLDALADNEPLQFFYERARYEPRFEREHSGWRFVCFEKLLKGPEI
jgi:ribosomal protein S18 acetylase RimI-like enzyme